MSNNISINPVTAKLLSGELKLSEITLEQFREGRTIYNSYKEAKCKGYEAHHVIPRSCQEELTDDRCLRLTAFEHIIDHYLMAKEKPEYTYLFYCMINYNEKRCNLSEQELLEKCIEVSNLRESGRKISSVKNALPYEEKYGKEKSNKIKEKQSKNSYWKNTNGPMNNKHHTEISKKKISETSKNRIFTEYTRNQISKALLGNKNSLGHYKSVDERIKISNSKKEIGKLWVLYKNSESYVNNHLSWNEFQKSYKSIYY